MKLELRHLNISAFAAVCAAVAYTSLMPIPENPSQGMKVVLAKDYLFHLFAYFAVAFTAMLAFVKRPVVFMERVNLWLLCVLAGSVLEILQATVPGVNRSCMVSDFVSNSAGAALGAFLTPAALLSAREKAKDNGTKQLAETV